MVDERFLFLSDVAYRMVAPLMNKVGIDRMSAVYTVKVVFKPGQAAAS